MMESPVYAANKAVGHMVNFRLWREIVWLKWNLLRLMMKSLVMWRHSPVRPGLL